MSWDIAVGIMSMATFGIALGRVIVKLTSAITRLQGAVENVNHNLNSLEKRVDKIERIKYHEESDE